MRTLAEVMTDEVLYLLPTDSVLKAAQEMKKLNVGIIPICDGEQRLLGVITDRDIVLRVVAEGDSPDKVKLQDIASMDPISGQRDWRVADAVDLMSRNQIRRLPIVEQGRLVGIVSLGDIAVHDSEVAASVALEEISRPAMPRKGEMDEGHTTA
ncbi:MAG: CBS domain-containing protein [Ardenticatenales bacterium]|nr:CBS domain-containing protein [Ardenticatenales bacterium]